VLSTKVRTATVLTEAVRKMVPTVERCRRLFDDDVPA
jgi:hypothetical protein